MAQASKYVSRSEQLEAGSTLTFSLCLFSGVNLMEMKSPSVILEINTSQLSETQKIESHPRNPEKDVFPEGSSLVRNAGSLVLTLQPVFLQKFTPGVLTIKATYIYEKQGLEPLSIENVIETQFMSGEAKYSDKSWQSTNHLLQFIR